jgi:ACR3 family arsenite efflux pump ArsB
MANLDKRGRYVSRRQREEQAYRMVQAGSATAVGTVGTGALAVAGVVSPLIPFLLLIATVLLVLRFRRATGQR